VVSFQGGPFDPIAFRFAE